MAKIQSSSSLVRCNVCQHLRVSEKYRRHLYLHVNAGQISSHEAEEIIFKSKYTRKNSKSKIGIAVGHLCTVTNHIVECM